MSRTMKIENVGKENARVIAEAARRALARRRQRQKGGPRENPPD